ncbi:hypothetical protein [Saccharothrix lopnurensis]|uniref:Uncharacterized protein n=1 Tax=Saccharothrix lopnurensis TaxID=1670621 RepID=A0ABW1PIV9_9PSEU
MFFTYRPADGDEQRWEFVAAEVRASQAEPIEKSYGQPWDVFLVDVFKGAARARRHLLWHLMRTDHPALRYEDVPDFALGEVELAFDRGELEAMREQLAGQLTAEQLTQLDALVAEAPEGRSGKALSNRRERRTASRSRSTSTSGSKTRKR